MGETFTPIFRVEDTSVITSCCYKPEDFALETECSKSLKS